MSELSAAGRRQLERALAHVERVELTLHEEIVELHHVLADKRDAQRDVQADLKELRRDLGIEP